MPTIRYPYKTMEIRPQLTAEEWTHMGESETAAGNGPDRERPSPDFRLRVTRVSSVGTGLTPLRPPNWLKKMLVEQRSHEEVLQFLEKRVEATPTESRLREAQVILNEIGRLPEGGKLVRAALTQKLVTFLTGQGR